MVKYDFTKINNDANGNPRYVVHFLDLLIPTDKHHPLEEQYNIAVKRANKIGGKKYHNKSYGGGIVFQSYNINDLAKKIDKIKDDASKPNVTTPKKTTAKANSANKTKATTKKNLLGDFDDKHHTEMSDKEYLQFINRQAQKLREKSGIKKKETKTLVYYNLSSKAAKKKAFEKFKR
ncbi:MAG: hypothetical protein U0Y10_17730 [Spirosomataceae bacterium]